jgi:hypothetical protein
MLVMQFPPVIRAKGEGRRSADLFLIMRLLSNRSNRLAAIGIRYHEALLYGRRQIKNVYPIFEGAGSDPGAG